MGEQDTGSGGKPQGRDTYVCSTVRTAVRPPTSGAAIEDVVTVVGATDRAVPLLVAACDAASVLLAAAVGKLANVAELVCRNFDRIVASVDRNRVVGDVGSELDEVCGVDSDGGGIVPDGSDVDRPAGGGIRAGAGQVPTHERHRPRGRRHIDANLAELGHHRLHRRRQRGRDRVDRAGAWWGIYAQVSLITGRVWRDHSSSPRCKVNARCTVNGAQLTDQGAAWGDADHHLARGRAGGGELGAEGGKGGDALLGVRLPRFEGRHLGRNWRQSVRVLFLRKFVSNSKQSE